MSLKCTLCAGIKCFVEWQASLEYQDWNLISKISGHKERFSNRNLFSIPAKFHIKNKYVI